MAIFALSGPISDMGNYINIVSLILAILVLGTGDFFLFILFRRNFPRIFIVATEVLGLVCWLMGFNLPAFICLMMLLTGTICFYVANAAESKNLTANNLKGKNIDIPLFKRRKHKGESLFNREEMYAKIQTAVITMSKQKIGAIITFEKKDNLDDVMKSGTIINAPVSAELLQTIFYEGTRLHDGAVIIRNDMIVAASVYFTPTTRPLTGKFGSRHRAAIGISEICDAVTVVVSEETGRISIAHKGELTTVTPDNFLSTFEEAMAFQSEPKKDDEI